MPLAWSFLKIHSLMDGMREKTVVALDELVRGKVTADPGEGWVALGSGVGTGAVGKT